jgi:hypothetical protein
VKLSLTIWQSGLELKLPVSMDYETDDLDLLKRIATTDSVLELAFRIRALRIGLTGWHFF